MYLKKSFILKKSSCVDTLTLVSALDFSANIALQITSHERQYRNFQIESAYLPSKYAVQERRYENSGVRVQAMVEQLSERPAGAGATSLLAIDAVWNSACLLY